ncbi:VanZ family protein [Paenibacillus tarimensis]|uniref:VanZ family protein n=1 Tax=Paenibacillus tarimensis TaxID=416012 RepID=UPI001F3DC651|nr:VanZ family protein [Paenibacillus tarimensis]
MRPDRKSRITSITALGILLVYTCLLVYWMFFAFGRSAGTGIEGYSYNLTPFSTIQQFLNIQQYNVKTWATNLIGNIGVFLPYGILMPVIVRRLSFRWFLTGFMLWITLVEWIQMLSRRGSFDIDDVILNSLGACIGWAAYASIRRMIR